jgi:hypothetical protein
MQKDDYNVLDLIERGDNFEEDRELEDVKYVR